jgi:hypothetical protein
VKTSIRVQISRRYHKPLLQGYGSHQIQKEGLASTVLPYDNAKCRAAICDAINVGH